MLLIDKLSAKPVYEQVVDGIERGVLLGIYEPGAQVPSLRELSVSLGINPNTIQKSYAELTRRGVICPSPGSGCYVAYDAKERIKTRARQRLSDLKKLASELLDAGVSEDELMLAVSSACKTKNENEGGKEL